MINISKGNQDWADWITNLKDVTKISQLGGLIYYLNVVLETKFSKGG